MNCANGTNGQIQRTLKRTHTGVDIQATIIGRLIFGNHQRALRELGAIFLEPTHGDRAGDGDMTLYQ